VSYIILTSAAPADELVLRDTDGSGDLKIPVKAKNADETVPVDLTGSPVVFPNAIHATITAGATATLILKSRE